MSAFVVVSVGRANSRTKANRESGYALLMVIFMVASLLLFAVAASPNIVIEGRRLREQEVVWRGNQYVRAIRLYYQKNGRYPQTIDDLTKADNAGNYYLRKTYTDLNNTDDGSWRFIYVSASGQLIGSVRYHSLQEMAIAQGFGMSLGTIAGGGILGQGTGATGQAGATGQTGVAGQTGQTGTGQNGSAGSGFGSSTQPQSLAPLEPVDGPVLGGFLIGVGGKMKKPTIMVYQGGKSDYEWEFIWNPLAAGGAIGATGAAQPAAGANGTATPGTGTTPGATPGTSGAPTDSQGNPTNTSAPNPPASPVGSPTPNQ